MLVRLISSFAVETCTHRLFLSQLNLQFIWITAIMKRNVLHLRLTVKKHDDAFISRKYQTVVWAKLKKKSNITTSWFGQACTNNMANIRSTFSSDSKNILWTRKRLGYYTAHARLRNVHISLCNLRWPSSFQHPCITHFWWLRPVRVGLRARGPYLPSGGLNWVLRRTAFSTTSSPARWNAIVNPSIIKKRYWVEPKPYPR